jgi:hypothetical protein
MTMEFPDIRGWMEDENRQAMYDWILATNAQTVVEVGVYAGRMTVAMAMALKQTGGVLHSCDPYLEMGADKGLPILAECMQHLTELNLRGVVRLHICSSAALRAVWPNNKRVDLAWIDGCHYIPEEVDADLYGWCPIARRFMGHDTHLPVVSDRVKAYAAAHMLRVVTPPPGMVNTWEMVG